MTLPLKSASLPCTRRQALGLLSAGASFLAWPAWSSAREKLPDFQFLVVSDTHLGRNDNDSATKQWQKTAKELEAAKGDFILHLGDLVDQGREKQYEVFQEIRKTIQKPMYEIPGNHDPQPLFEKYIRKQVDTSFSHAGVRFVLFNNAHTDSHDGFITQEQIAWLAEQLAAAAKADEFVILCCHVPVHENKHPDRGWYVKADQGQTAFYEALGHHRQRVLGLFHGHFHNGIRGWDDHGPWHEICFPSALYNQDRKLADQKEPGYNVTEFRPGYVLVRLNQQGMLLQYIPLGEAGNAERMIKLTQFDAP